MQWVNSVLLGSRTLQASHLVTVARFRLAPKYMSHMKESLQCCLKWVLVPKMSTSFEALTAKVQAASAAALARAQVAQAEAEARAAAPQTDLGEAQFIAGAQGRARRPNNFTETTVTRV